MYVDLCGAEAPLIRAAWAVLPSACKPSCLVAFSALFVYRVYQVRDGNRGAPVPGL